MRFIGNIVWFVLGGFLAGLSWWIAALACALTIVGIPFAVAAFRIGALSFWPFGREVIESSAGGANEVLGLLGNLVWILIGGWWLALQHLAWALLFAVTIIGIPFAIQHLKLAGLSLTPFGKAIVVAV